MSSICAHPFLFRGGRKAKEKRKEMKTELCPPAKRNLIKRKYSI